jgi:predicted nuclease with TOPRIM domain
LACRPKERLAQLEAEEQQLEEALEATHHELATTSARLRAVEAELEQAEAEAALHRSAAEHAAAIAEKYAEERDSSRAELERC